MTDILQRIAAAKRREIERLHRQFDLRQLQRTTPPTRRSFYLDMENARRAGRPFFITEFKRKSPSAGWINPDVDLAEQVRRYAAAGAGAVSVLTDAEFFGGSYADLQAAAAALGNSNDPAAPLLLQKDFILDPIQIYLARRAGADLILLIAALLPPDRLEALRQTAEALGMGVLVEVHSPEELEAVRDLPFPVLGVNNRDLRSFRTALNRVNRLGQQAAGRFLIAESGIRDERDFQFVRRADGFLIGTCLMQNGAEGIRHWAPRFLFKACGIRTAALLREPPPADYLGINFSLLSKRRIAPDLLYAAGLPARAVAVFFKNSETEIRAVLARYPFEVVQLYAGDVSPEFVRSLKQKVLLACRVQAPADLEQLEHYALDVDAFILDGAAPGSGQAMETTVPADFPYPFLLAGGLHAGKLELALHHPNCVGVDIASGIETAGEVDVRKIEEIRRRLNLLSGPGVPAAR